MVDVAAKDLLFVSEMELDGDPVQPIQSNAYQGPRIHIQNISQYPLDIGYPIGLDIQSYPAISIRYYRIG